MILFILTPRNIKYLGFEISIEKRGGIDHDTFTTLQVHLRRLHDWRYKLYSNGMLMNDFYGNQVAYHDS